MRQLRMREVARGFVPFLFSSGVSAASMLALFAVYAHRVSLSELGLFGLQFAVIGAISNVVAVTFEQRLLQIVVGKDDAESYLSRFSTARSLVALLVSGMYVVAALQLGLGLSLCVSGGLLVFAQSLYSAALGCRVVSANRRSQVVLQAVAGLSIGVWLVFVWLGGFDVTVPLMLAGVAAARIVTVMVDAVRHRSTFRPRASISELIQAVSRDWNGRLQPSRFWSVLGMQTALALSSTVDVVLIGRLDVVSVTVYQAVQRPVQALAVVNGAVGQFSLGHFARGGRGFGKVYSLRFAVPVVLGYALISTGIVWSYSLVLPVSLQGNFLLAALIGAGYGAGMLMAISGQRAILAAMPGVVVASSVVQIGATAVTIVLLGPALGALAAGLGFCVGRLLCLPIHSRALLRM